MAVNLRNLGERIEKLIKIEDNDIEPNYVYFQKEIPAMSKMCLDLIHQNFDELLSSGKIRKIKSAHPILRDLIVFVKNDIEKHGRWSFWHYSALTIITCFRYLECIQQNKHNTLDLSNPEKWLAEGSSYTLDAATLTLKYMTAKMYPSALENIMKAIDGPDVDMNVASRYLKKRIEMLRS
jgi:hypothetical protein